MDWFSDFEIFDFIVVCLKVLGLDFQLTLFAQSLEHVQHFVPDGLEQNDSGLGIGCEIQKDGLEVVPEVFQLSAHELPEGVELLEEVVSGFGRKCRNR